MNSYAISYGVYGFLNIERGLFMTKNRRTLRAAFAMVLSIVMLLSFAMPALAAYDEVPALSEEGYEAVLPVEEAAAEAEEYVGFAPVYEAIVPAVQLIAPTGVSIGNPAAANQQIVWDAVPGATGYTVYAFESATETDSANAVRSQNVAATATNFNIASGEFLGDMAVQAFALPLPAGTFYFRVRALAADPLDNSPISAAVSAAPGRRVNTAQATALINDPVIGANGFIAIDVRIQTASMATGAIQLPIDNRTGTNGAFTVVRNQEAFDRFQLEIQAHPNYNGAESLIFIY